MIRSLRFRLLLQTSLAAVIVLGSLGFALYFFVERSVNANFNQALLTEARGVAATAEQHGDKIVFDYAPDELPKFTTDNHPDYFEAWIDPDVIIRSPSLGDGNLPRPVTIDDTVYRDIPLPDGRQGRMVALSFTTTIEPKAEENSSTADSSRIILLTVATDTIVLQRSLKSLFLLMSGLCGLAIVVSGAILYWVVGRGVRPVERLAADIDQLRENDLSIHLQAPEVPTELQPVVEKLNALLQRLDDAFQREKAFTADVAHELRGPLAALLTTFDVCRSRPRDEPAYISAIDKCREVARQMQAMVETLLMLARVDAGQLTLQVKSLDVADLLEDCWALFLPGAQKRRLTVQWNVPSPIAMESDPEKLRIVFHNIFDNAVSYADDGGTIRVSAQARPAELLVEIANTGSTIAPDKTGQLFDRFWRGDEARTQTGLHCGLGLSLCQRLSRLLHGQIEIESTPQKWFIVRLRLPFPAAQKQIPVQPNITVPETISAAMPSPGADPRAPQIETATRSS